DARRPPLSSPTRPLLPVPLAAWGSGAIGLLGIWLALSVTAIARGIAMAMFWLGGAWRRATVRRLMATLITLLTDFGNADRYVGEVDGVPLSPGHGPGLLGRPPPAPPR